MAVENCVAYSSSAANECATCATGFYPFKYSHTCDRIQNPIPNCSAYTSVSTCSACNNGYFLQGNSCVLYTTLPNCKEANGSGACVKCLGGFALTSASPPTCKPVHSYIAENCATLAPDATFKAWTVADGPACATCKDNS